MRRISRCLNAKLTEICHQSIKLEELSQKVNAYLSEPLRGQCQVGSFHKGTLILIASNSGFASQLRYVLPDLRDHLRHAGIYQLSSIKITVSTFTAQANQPQAKKSHLSTKARAAIIEHATHCNYLPLQEALLRLARKNTS